MARAPSSRASTVSATTKVARKLSEDEINILKSQLEAWKNKRNRPAVYRGVHKEAKKLDCIRNMSRDEWDIRKEAYKNWLYNHGRRKATKRLVKYGKTCTARDVIKVQKKEEIQNLIEVERGAKPGDREMIACYQWGVNQVINGLTEEEVQEAERQAEEWRKAKPPPEVQARTALQKGERYAREFAEEMWRQCGMRVALLGTWKDRNGQIMTTQFDINEEIDDGEAFTGWGGVHQRWMEYAKKALGDTSSGDEGPSDSEVDSDASRRPRKKKSTKAKTDPLSLVRKGDKAWIVDIKDASLEVMKQMIRGFITFHYRKASGTKNGSVPWMQISGQRSDYIAAKYLPERVKLREPSKLQKKEVIAILEFWRKRQESDPEDVFSFRKWQDSTGTLQNPVDSDSDQEAALRRRKASKGKRKAASDDGLTRKGRINSRLVSSDSSESSEEGGDESQREWNDPGSEGDDLTEGTQHLLRYEPRKAISIRSQGTVVVQKTKGRAAVDEGAEEEESDGRSAISGIGPSKNQGQAISDGDDRGSHCWASAESEPHPMTSRASKARASYTGRPAPELNSEDAHPSTKTKSTATKKTLGQDLKAESKRGRPTEMRPKASREPQDVSADDSKAKTKGGKPTQMRRRVPIEPQHVLEDDPEEQPRRSKRSRLMPARFLDASPQPKVADKRKRN